MKIEWRIHKSDTHSLSDSAHSIGSVGEHHSRLLKKRLWQRINMVLDLYIYFNQISYYLSCDTRQIISSISLFSLVIKIFIMTQTTEGCSGTENTQKSTFQFILRALKRLWNFKTDSLNYLRKKAKERNVVCFCTSCLSWQVRYCSCWKDTLFHSCVKFPSIKL